MSVSSLKYFIPNSMQHQLQLLQLRVRVRVVKQDTLPSLALVDLCASPIDLFLDEFEGVELGLLVEDREGGGAEHATGVEERLVERVE